MRDPRNQRRYREARTAWLAGYGGGAGLCCLCRAPVDTSLPGTHPWGPTIEHTLPIRAIVTIARTDAEALALCCDTSRWALSHRRCNSQQGQAVTASINKARNQQRRPRPRDLGASRDW